MKEAQEDEGTAVAYLNGGTPNSGVRIAMEYGDVDLTVNNASVIAKASSIAPSSPFPL